MDAADAALSHEYWSVLLRPSAANFSSMHMCFRASTLSCIILYVNPWLALSSLWFARQGYKV